MSRRYVPIFGEMEQTAVEAITDVDLDECTICSAALI